MTSTRRRAAGALRRIGVLAAAFCTLLVAADFGTAAADDAYRLGPRDRLRVKVNEWRAAKGEVHEWESLNGEYTVGSEGAVSFPLLGEVPAAGRTTAELSAALGDRLRSIASLLQRPSASVEIAEYRPFFITGHVEKPGEYPFRPNLTVLQAVSIAGGLYRLPDPGILRFGRDAALSRGELRAMEAERLALAARRERLQAEIANRSEPAFEGELRDLAGDPLVRQILQEERQVFASRRAALASQVAALRQAQALFAQEIEVLKEKSAALDRQLVLARRELESVTGLVNRGLAVTARQLTLEQNAAQYESQKLDIGLAQLRATQEAARAERSIGDLQDRRRTEALDLLRDTQIKLATLVEKMSTARALVFEAEVTAPQLALGRAAGSAQEPVYTIIRRNASASEALTAAETEALRPGDVLKVERPTPPGPPPRQAASR